MKKRYQIVALPFEGGHFGLTDDQGNEYLPIDLPPQLRRAGLTINCDIEVITHMSSLINWGVPVRIKSFEIAR